LAFACASWAATSASGAPGDIHFLGCVSGDAAALVSAGKGCDPAPSPAPGGTHSGLDQLRSVAVSPDGSDVYAVAEAEDAIFALRRDAATGQLSVVNCITGNSSEVPCVHAPHATAGGAGSGMNLSTDVVVSPDGRHVYAAAPWDDAVAVFDRDAATGALSWNSCLTSRQVAGVSGGGSCAEVPNSGLGTGTGLADLRYLAISPDGADVYAAGLLDKALVDFDRDPASGELTFAGCVTGKTSVTTAAGGNCAGQVPGVNSGGDNNALDDVHALAVAPDGTVVYTVSEDQAAIAAFERAPEGAVGFGSCVTGLDGAIAEAGGCATTPNVTVGGINSGLGRLFDVAVSPDGRDIYAVSQTDDAISTFRHDPGSGDLAFAGCVTANNGASTLLSGRNCAPLPGSSPTGAGSGLDGTVSLAISPDGRRLYTSASFDDAVAAFDRDPDSGALSRAGCLAGNSAATYCALVPGAADGGAGSGLSELLSIEVSGTGGELYTAATGDDAVGWFAVEPAPAASPFTSPAADTVAPVVSGLRITPQSFAVVGRGRARAASSAKRRRARTGATVKFNLSEQAGVAIGVQRRLPGRRRRARGSSRCVKPTRALARSHAKRCARFIALRPPLARAGRRGANSLRFSGRLGRHRLGPGRYRMVIRATDAAGNASKPRRRAFRIVASGSRR
jgi:6-phosphogluconolactonase (cycloisomerase 2 family)